MEYYGTKVAGAGVLIGLVSSIVVGIEYSPGAGLATFSAFIILSFIAGTLADIYTILEK